MRVVSSFLVSLFASSLAACGARTALVDGLSSTRDAGAPPAVSDGSCGSLATNATLVSLPSAGELALPIALNDTNVYWLYWGPDDADRGSVMTVPKCGGDAVTLASGQAFLGTIAVDSDNVYWTNLGDAQGSVMRLAIHGTIPVTLATGQDPVGVALDATYVFWTDAFGGTVMKMAKSGGAPTTIATEQFSAGELAVNATDACWTINNGNFPDEVPGVVCVRLSGGTPFTVASGNAIYWGLALDATTAYSLSGDGSGSGSIIAIPLAGGTAVTLGSGDPAGIAVDQANVYWTNNPEDGGTGSVIRVPKRGGDSVTLAAGQINVGAVAVDSQHVFWTDDPSVFVDGGPAVLAGPK